MEYLAQGQPPIPVAHGGQKGALTTSPCLPTGGPQALRSGTLSCASVSPGHAQCA